MYNLTHKTRTKARKTIPSVILTPRPNHSAEHVSCSHHFIITIDLIFVLEGNYAQLWENDSQILILPSYSSHYRRVITPCINEIYNIFSNRVTLQRVYEEYKACALTRRLYLSSTFAFHASRVTIVGWNGSNICRMHCMSCSGRHLTLEIHRLKTCTLQT